MREFVIFDWCRPSAEAVAQWLLEAHPSMGCFDLSSVLVLVPTQQAGRRLREELARLSRENGLLAPMLRTPAQFLDPGGDGVASLMESVATLADALEKLRPPDARALFPKGIPFRTFGQRAAFARTFLSMRASLSEVGLSISSAVRRLPADAESERWADLVFLEEAYRAALRRLGKVDHDDARLAAAKNPSLPPEIRQVILACVADLQPLAVAAIERLPGEVAVTVLTSAAPEDRASFDDWGRPLPEAWENRDPGWERPEEQIRLVARPEDAAEALTNLLPPGERPSGDFLEIGLLDRGLLAPLKKSLDAAGGVLHDPEGELLAGHWLATLLANCGSFFENPTFKSARELLRHGAVIALLNREGIHLQSLLLESDIVRTKSFPTTAEDAARALRPHAPLRKSLERLAALRTDCLGRDWVKFLRDFLESALAEFTRQLDPAGLAALDAAAGAIATALDQLEDGARSHPGISAPEWISLVVAGLQHLRHYPERESGAVEASGWLELAWSSTPHVVLAGFNQGVVPAPMATSPLLPEGTRERLGLPGMRERTARDSYFLSRILALRAGNRGRVDVLASQIDAEENPLRPSPLLFAGAGAALAKRVQDLFAEPMPPRPDPAWQAGWMFEPGIREPGTGIGVTDFARYLDCPFTFYLRSTLKMEEFDPEPDEMDARVFGDLVHTALKHFALHETDRELRTKIEIRAALQKHLDDYVDHVLGSQLSLPLLVQVEAARERLGAFASAQEQFRRDGWRIDQVERSFEELLGRPWLFEGWQINGRIDRIDFHEASGRWRLLDYKTSESSEDPAKKHIRGPRSREREWPPGYARITDATGSFQGWWRNLQLPIYRQLLIESGRAPDSITCGYLNLPKKLADTGLLEWSDYTESLASSALVCMRGVLADISRHRFWPPNSAADYQGTLEAFFPFGAENVVDSNGSFARWARAS